MRSKKYAFYALLFVLVLFTISVTVAQDSTQEATSGSLTVLEWAYYDVPDMWADFGAKYPDVKVSFNFGASDEDIFAKTKAGSGEDIVHFYTPFLKFYVDEGLIQPIDV